MGAGVQGIDAYTAADKIGLSIVSGECPTVGLAGGYTQGGGHSLLAAKYGLAADQALSWEVVTGTGEIVTASRTENTDLYWAMSGGGGGTYGVAYSLTAKVHPDLPVAAANVSFTMDGISQDTFFEAVAAYHSWAPALIDKGATPLSFGSNATFAVGPIIAPGMRVAELQTIFKPFMAQLDELQVKYTPPFFKLYRGYKPAYEALMPTIPVGIQLYGGRLISREVIQDNVKGVFDAFRNITNDGVSYSSLGVKLDKSVTGDVDNAITPAWRKALYDIVLAV